MWQPFDAELSYCILSCIVLFVLYLCWIFRNVIPHNPLPAFECAQWITLGCCLLLTSSTWGTESIPCVITLHARRMITWGDISLPRSLFFPLSRKTNKGTRFNGTRHCVCNLHICMVSLWSIPDGAPFGHTHSGVIHTCPRSFLLEAAINIDLWLDGAPHIHTHRGVIIYVSCVLLGDFSALLKSEIDMKVWEVEGRTCSTGPRAGIEPGSLRSGLSFNATRSTS